MRDCFIFVVEGIDISCGPDFKAVMAGKERLQSSDMLYLIKHNARVLST